MVRIGILTAIWKRHALTRCVLRHYARLKVPGVEFVLAAVGSEKKKSRELAHDADWCYVEAPNHKLGGKWNAGMRSLRSTNVDAVVIVGSDDVLNAEYFDAMAAHVAAGTDLFTLRGLWFLDAPTNRLSYNYLWFTGAGAMVSRAVLDKVAWRPWEAERTRYLDTSLLNAVMPHARRRGFVSDLRETPARLLDVKTDRNMWSYDASIQRCASSHPVDDPAAWLDRYFPEFHADLMAAELLPITETASP